MSKIFQYFVEGECEEKLINTLKAPPMNALIPGKVEVLNVVCSKISKQRLMVLKPKTNIILVYDTDVAQTDILEENVRMLKSYGFTNIYHIQSIRTFEDELVYASKIAEISEMYHTVSLEDFKKKFIHQSNLKDKLASIQFQSERIWSRVNTNLPFSEFASKEAVDRVKANPNAEKEKVGS